MIGWQRLLPASAVAAAVLLAAPAVAQRYHRVKDGQTLGQIAKKYRVTVWDLALENDFTPERFIHPGQALEIPPRGVTFVRPGETLHRVARRVRCDVAELARVNGTTPDARTHPGMRLVLPGHEDAAPAPNWGQPETRGTVQLQIADATHTVVMVGVDGRVHKGGLETLEGFMQRVGSRPSRAKRPAPARLAALLAAISDHFGGRTIRLVSGYRATGNYTGEASRHRTGRAIDIRVNGVETRYVWEYCRSLLNTGCGFYPRSTFVHVDVREGPAQWVDWSRPGERPLYGTLRGPYGEHVPKGERRKVRREVTRESDVPAAVAVAN